MKRILEPEKRTPITNSFDVAVVGGGIAGVSAALAAARTGVKRVVLIEKQYALGGLATLGLVTIYLPLCDGCGNQVSFGISEELLKLSVKHGAPKPIPKPWLGPSCEEARKKERFLVQYDPNVFAILAEQLLLEHGVTLLYGTAVVDTICKDSRIDALILENIDGRTAIEARCVVDASGDAVICQQAGEVTKVFKQQNVLAAWYYAQEQDSLNLHTLGASDIPESEKDGSEPIPLVTERFTGLNAAQVSRMTALSHQIVLKDFLSSGEVSMHHALASVASIPQLRMTRRLDGRYTLDAKEVFIHFKDSIGQISSWKKPGPVYEIPFRTLIGNRVKNLIAAGRNISVTDEMWDLTRVIPACAVTGEAAGVAAAITNDFGMLDVTHLQAKLKLAGVKCTGAF